MNSLMSTLAINKRARVDYKILDNFEAGIMLSGQEVKSVRGKNISLKGSYVTVNSTGPGGTPEAWLVNCHISPYKHAGALPHYEPTHSRKLLLHRKEINTLIGKMKQQGLTLVPLKLYTRKSRIKLAFGLGRGKKEFDKRQDIKKRDTDRAIGRALRKKI